MRRISLALVLVVLLVFGACAAWALPSFRGYTGLVKVPSANTLDAGESSFGVMTEATDESQINDAFAMYGIGGNVELGINSYQASEGVDRKTLINAKYCFSRNPDTRSSYAVGIIDAANEVQQTGYVVATKAIVRRTKIFANIVSSVRAHVGLGVGELNGAFAGLSVYAGNRVAFSAEWDSKDINLGFRLTPIRGLRLHAAVFDVGNKQDLGAGISYTRTY